MWHKQPRQGCHSPAPLRKHRGGLASADPAPSLSAIPTCTAGPRPDRYAYDAKPFRRCSFIQPSEHCAGQPAPHRSPARYGITWLRTQLRLATDRRLASLLDATLCDVTADRCPPGARPATTGVPNGRPRAPSMHQRFEARIICSPATRIATSACATVLVFGAGRSAPRPRGPVRCPVRLRANHHLRVLCPHTPCSCRPTAPAGWGRPCPAGTTWVGGGTAVAKSLMKTVAEVGFMPARWRIRRLPGAGPRPARLGTDIVRRASRLPFGSGPANVWSASGIAGQRRQGLMSG